MAMTRRQLGKWAAGVGTVALAPALPLRAAAPVPVRMLVELRLEGGHDGWNLAVPTDSRYHAYRLGRGPRLALPRERLVPLAGSGSDSGLGLHPALAPLLPAWQNGRLALLVGSGALPQPLTRARLRQRPDLAPAGLMRHDGAGPDGFLEALAAALPEAGLMQPSGPMAAQLAAAARAAADSAAGLGPRHVAVRVTQAGHDTHSDQTAAGDPCGGRQGALFAELAAALAGFEAEIAALGLAGQVLLYTRSEFGRAYRGNPERGTDHGWGNIQIVLGGGLAPQGLHGAYPSARPGGDDDAGPGDGRWIPALAEEQHLGPLAAWFGVPPAAALPHWRAWQDRPLPLFAPLA